VAKSYLATSPPVIPREDIELRAPITKMDKVLCIGMNYKDHCEEQGVPTPKEPLVFNKFPSCVAGPYVDLPLPRLTSQLDWEVELCVVIGKVGRDVKQEEAMDYVYGYTTAHDVSARDWQLQRNGGQWLLGKAMEAFAAALRQLPSIIAENGGYDSAQLVSELKAAHHSGQSTMGLNMYEGQIGCMSKLGITESFSVKRQVLVQASEAAEMILRVDDILKAAPRPRKEDRGHC